MKNNKGFSLVELIIVIAIMAILVGVMAPQLIKYIEKTNVSADVQLCDTFKGAITTTIMDPAVLTNTAATVPSFGTTIDMKDIAAYDIFGDQVKEIVGFDFSSDSNIQAKMKSSAKDNGGVMKVKIDDTTNAVLVWITQSDMSGKKSKHDDPSSSDTSSAIFAGDASIY